MKFPKVKLQEVNRKDVKRISEWIKDDEISDLWFGRYSYGEGIHLGYDPEKLMSAPEKEWKGLIKNTDHSLGRTIFSIISNETDEHIGEGQLAIEHNLGDAQLSLIIGRKDLWHKGYGSSSVIMLLDHAFNVLQLHRVWVDIPEFNEHARNMFDHIGFQHEGTLRQSRPHHGSRYNSEIMGILKSEFESVFPGGLENIFK